MPDLAGALQAYASASRASGTLRSADKGAAATLQAALRGQRPLDDPRGQLADKPVRVVEQRNASLFRVGDHPVDRPMDHRAAKPFAADSSSDSTIPSRPAASIPSTISCSF